MTSLHFTSIDHFTSMTSLHCTSLQWHHFTLLLFSFLFFNIPQSRSSPSSFSSSEYLYLMQAAVLHRHKSDLELTSLPIPSPGHGEVLVRVIACGVCHTDLHIIDGDWRGHECRLPLCPGHEGVGLITALGQGVTTLSMGDRVGLPWLASACGHCHFCTTGSISLLSTLMRSVT